MLIKICGLKEPENIRQVSAIQGVDLIGLIFYAPSTRYVDSETIAHLLPTLTSVKKTGVFVNESKEEVIRKCAFYQLDYLQLHGNERPEYLSELLAELPSRVKLIKAFSIHMEKDLLLTSGYEEHCEYFLFDTQTNGYGGSGRTFDWNILQYYTGSTPFLLSGGIGPDSYDSLHHFHHQLWAGIDLNSRFETAPGVKDIALLSDFIQNIQLHHP